MQRRGWTTEQIAEAIARGARYPAVNAVNPHSSATRYVHPESGKSVIVDDNSGEVLHVGAADYKY